MKKQLLCVDLEGNLEIWRRGDSAIVGCVWNILCGWSLSIGDRRHDVVYHIFGSGEEPEFFGREVIDEWLG